MIWRALTSQPWRAVARALGAAAGPVLPLSPRGLHVCVRCGRDRVTRVGWEPRESGWTTISLYCGECEARRQVTVPDAEAAVYRAVLDRHRREIEAALRELDFTR